MKKWILGILLLLVVLLGLGWLSLERETRNLIAHMPTDADILFWPVDQRDAAFRAMDSLPILAKSSVIDAGEDVYALPKGEPLAIDATEFMAQQRSAGIVILHNGKIVFEKYGLDFDGEGKWTSFSVAKSVTSTLAGAAVKDGAIKSLDDKVTDYIADLKGSAYDDVTVEQLLTMTSGVRWNEDYGDPESDVALFNKHAPEKGMNATVSYMRSLPREAPAGEKWVYKTGETNLIGILVSEATGKPLSQYLSEKIWAPFGMEQDGSWLLDSTGHEISGCCIQASIRDFARFGQFMLNDGKAGGQAILPEGWIAKATQKHVGIGVPGKGYGYQWWTNDDGTYGAQGLFGQAIFIDHERNLIVASNSNWPSTKVQDSYKLVRDKFHKKIQDAIDGKNGGDEAL